MCPIMGFFWEFAKRNTVGGVIRAQSGQKNSGCTVQSLERMNNFCDGWNW